jgi:hypothetical protein
MAIKGAHPEHRRIWVSDPFGYVGALATMKETLPPEEVETRMIASFS